MVLMSGRASQEKVMVGVELPKLVVDDREVLLGTRCGDKCL